MFHGIYFSGDICYNGLTQESYSSAFECMALHDIFGFVSWEHRQVHWYLISRAVRL